MHRLGNQFVQQKIRMGRYEGRLLGDSRIREIFFDLLEIFFNGDDMLLQKFREITREIPVDSPQG